MKRFLPIITIVLATILTLVSAAPAAAAQKLRITEGNISGRGDTVVYPVEVGFGHSLYALVTPSEGSRLDPYLRLYDSASPYAEPIWEDDDSAGGVSPYIVYWPLLPGRYYLEVSGYAATSGNFIMTYGAFHPWSSTIHSPGTHDSHSFYGERGDIVRIETLRPSDSELDPYVIVVNPNGMRTRFFTGPNGGPDVSVVAELTSTGRYRILVGGEDRTVGDYTLLIATSD